MNENLPVTDAERRQIMHNVLTLETTQGNRVAWAMDFEAHVYRMPQPINHILHAVMSLLTFGLWVIFVWLPLILCQPKPVLVGLYVDEYGRVHQFTPEEATARWLETLKNG